AKDNTFAGYSGQLFLHNEEAMNNYYEALYCWGKFFDDKYEAMTLPETIECEFQTIEGNQGDQIQLTAIIKPANVSLPHVFWHSTNSVHASVDPTGLVTFHDTNSSNPESHLLSIRPMAAEAPCKIIATSLFMDSPVFEVLVNPTSQPAQEGDLNGDGVINSVDLMFLIRHIAEPANSTLDTKTVDLNSDGKVDSVDLMHHIKMIVNN
ncbi:MAG: Ig-like domain-containing protein, partial [Muribaculaceae bacterium]|nr:Ig-like domain-containing protein [Muribaculaceae bacterium]